MEENRTEVESTTYQEEKNRDINHVLEQTNFSQLSKGKAFMNDNRIKQLASIREQVERLGKTV